MDLESIVDLSNDETERILHAFKQFISRRFYVDKATLEKAFQTEAAFVLNQQEDEDDVHAHLGELCFS